MDKINNKIYKNSGNEELLKLVPTDIFSVLDIGCGAGDNASFFAKRGILVDGITLSEKEAVLAQKYMREVAIFNLENGLPSSIKARKYDAVICSHVLEHICFPEKLLEDISQVLQSKGVLVIALPNLLHYVSRWELMKGNFKLEPSGIWDYTHFRWYTFQSAQRMLLNNGFQICKADVSISLPFGRFTRKLPLSIKKIFKIVSPGLFGSQLLYLTKPLK